MRIMRRVHTGPIVAAIATCQALFGWASPMPQAVSLAASQQGQVFAGHVDLPGVHLWFTDTGGGGIPIVLLHANTGTTATWERQNTALSAAGYRVVAFDRRGWGKSVADPATGPQPGTGAEDPDGLVRHLALGRFHLVGVAAGGFVAVDYASWRPEKLRSVTVAASTAGVREKETADYTARFQLPGFADWSPDAKELSLSYRASHPDGVRQWLDIEAHARQKGAPSQPLRTPNTYAKLESMSTPTLLMATDADFYAPPGLMKLFAAHIKNATWVLVPGAGHSVSWEQPEIFNKEILVFIRRHSR